MNLKLKITTFLLLLSIVNTNLLSQDKPITIKFDVGNVTDINKIIKNVKVIPLESSPDFLVGKFHPPIISESFIVLYDTKTVFCFDTMGNFVSKISKIGKGPGEYLSITSVVLNQQSNIVEILSQGNHKIFRYDIASGEYINSIDLPTLTYDFINISDQSYLFFSRGLNEDWPIDGFDSHHQIYLANYSSGTIINQFLSGSTRIFPWRPFNVVGDKVYTNVADSDSIYQFTNGRFEPYYVIDFGKHISTAEYWNTPFKKRKDIKKYLRWFSTNISESFLLINYQTVTGVPYNHFLYNRKTGAKTDFSFASSQPLEFPLDYHSCYLHDKYLVVVLQSFQLLDLDNQSKLYEEIKKTGIELDENSNPVLFFFELDF